MSTRETVSFEITVAGRKATLLTHAYPHADELLGMFLIEERGTPEFMRKHAVKGVVTVGIGNGAFDDHNRHGAKASSARLVAEELGLLRDPRVAGLISYIHRVDSEGGDLPFNLASIVKLMGQLEFNQLSVLTWACRGFWAKMNELEPTKDFSLQYLAMILIAENEKGGLTWLDYGMKAKVADFRAFHVEAKNEFAKYAKVSQVQTKKGPLTMVVIESDNPAIARYARSEFGASASIVVVKKSTGNVAIQFDKRLQLDLGDLAAAIKLTEQQVRGNVVVTDPQILRQDGTVDEAWDVWHFAHGGMLLNGSHTAKGISPTAISLQGICALIEDVLNPLHFEPDCAALCQMGICPAQNGTPCRLFPFGLARCRAIQAAAK